MKKIIGLLVFLLIQAGIHTSAQSIIDHLQKDGVGLGSVTIHQDEDIVALLNSDLASAKGNRSTASTTVKKQGYRVQVYVGNNTRASKNEASRIASDVRNKFPELTVYAMFNPPRWLCRVGDFRTIEEAHAAMREIRKQGNFREVSVVKDQIVLPVE
ncbi:MAG: SPOR domain-containing protein [Bacteroidaceae bacterium]|nr:SPOR domain-containing protein [Bacteroidaceae bacterium]MBQ9884146.1 SPOR domain-containing protein [Bacteroidaceae bacterium]